MKKIFYILFALSLFSCSTNDEAVAENQTEDLQPDKGYIFEMDQRKTLPSPEKYYRFFYENGHLQKMLGRNYSVTADSQFFYPDVITQLTYTNNKIQIDYLESGTTSGYRTTSYLMENSKPVKAEQYYKYNDGVSELEMSRTYTYGSNTISVYTKRGYQELFSTYYFDSNNNLSKSETLEKAGDKNKQFTTTVYSDFDNAKNPFKKLYLINDDFYEKSLSKNNFRAKESVIEYAESPGGITPQPGISKAKWTYNYDAHGQILLYFPF